MAHRKSYRFQGIGNTLEINEPAQATADSIIVRALLIVEGDYVDGNGNDSTFDVDRLNNIAEVTNNYLATDEDTPVFLSLHDFGGCYDPKDIVGKLLDGVFVGEITEDDLPEPGMTDILGKNAIFGLIQLSDRDAIARYNSRLNRKLSVGIGYFMTDLIYEVSLVPWGAIRGASLFANAGDLKVGDFASWSSSGGTAQGRIIRIEDDGEIDVPDADVTVMGTEDDPAALIQIYRPDDEGNYEETDTQVAHKFSALNKINALTVIVRASDSLAAVGDPLVAEGDRQRLTPKTYSDLPPNLQAILYGLTMGETKAQEVVEQAIDMVYQDWWTFRETIDDIRDADDDEIPEGRTKQSLISQAISDLTAALRDRLQVPASDPPQPVPLFSTNPSRGNSTMPDETNVNEQLTTLQNQNKQLTARLEAAEKETARMQRRSQISERYGNLRDRAQALLKDFKLSPNGYKDLFSESPAIDINHFCEPPEGQERKYNLDLLEAKIEYLEEHGVSVKPDSKQTPTTLDAGTEEMTAEMKAEYEAFEANRGRTKTASTAS